jgi:Ca2+-binding EF-hand superfamily protein
MGKERGTNPVEIKEFIQKFDINHDGEIDAEEMKMVFRKVINKYNNQVHSISPILKEINMI